MTLSSNKKYWLLCLWLYIIIATGKIAPIDETNTSSHVLVGAFSLYLSLIYLLQNKSSLNMLIKSVTYLMPLLISFSLSLIRTDDINYSLKKIEGGILASMISSIVAGEIIARIGILNFLKKLTSIGLISLTLTVIQRNIQGLVGREGAFLINGPIVFAWIMGINFISSIYIAKTTKSKIYLVYAVAFLIATIWTESKGPIIASILSSLLLIKISKKTLSSKKIFALIFSIVCIWLFYDYGLEYISQSESRLSAISRIAKNELSTMDEGSINARYELWSDSIKIWTDNPLFGIGLGNWSQAFSYTEFKYPHNIFIEVLSEQGIIGAILIASSIIPMWTRVSAIQKIFIIYFITCLSFSGDASYWRFIFYYPMGFILSKTLRQTKHE